MGGNRNRRFTILHLLNDMESSVVLASELVDNSVLGAALPTDIELVQEQEKDVALKCIIRYIKHGQLPEDNQQAETIMKVAQYYCKVVPKVFWKQVWF